MLDYYRDFVKYNLTDYSLIHLITGLTAETGEVAAEIQKAYYKNKVIDRKKLLEELGDVMFYIEALAQYWDSSTLELMKDNIKKLKDRR